MANWWQRKSSKIGRALARVNAPPDRGKMGTVTTIEIRASALNLPASERAALAHDLIASLDAEDPDPRADALWAAEIERRAREMADGSVNLVDADEVHAEIARRIRTQTARW